MCPWTYMLRCQYIRVMFPWIYTRAAKIKLFLSLTADTYVQIPNNRVNASDERDSKFVASTCTKNTTIWNAARPELPWYIDPTPGK